MTRFIMGENVSTSTSSPKLDGKLTTFGREESHPEGPAWSGVALTSGPGGKPTPDNDKATSPGGVSTPEDSATADFPNIINNKLLQQRADIIAEVSLDNTSDHITACILQLRGSNGPGRPFQLQTRSDEEESIDSPSLSHHQATTGGKESYAIEHNTITPPGGSSSTGTSAPDKSSSASSADTAGTSSSGEAAIQPSNGIISCDYSRKDPGDGSPRRRTSAEDRSTSTGGASLSEAVDIYDGKPQPQEAATTKSELRGDFDHESSGNFDHETEPLSSPGQSTTKSEPPGTATGENRYDTCIIETNGAGTEEAIDPIKSYSYDEAIDINSYDYNYNEAIDNSGPSDQDHCETLLPRGALPPGGTPVLRSATSPSMERAPGGLSQEHQENHRQTTRDRQTTRNERQTS